ncbi:MAG: DNA mismatch repair protein, partial [Lachnospiraceae bacterium]|nr:DNA mismatch repair protein [Lachnospiraceae bacterium]
MALLLPEDRGDDVLRSMDRAMGHMINKIAAKLRSLTSKYVSVSTAVITGLIPEFMYYIRFAEYIEKLSDAGFKLNTPDAVYDDERITKAVGLYNLRLADDIAFSENEKSAADVIGNDLVFDNDHRLYILTGANRGGKTTFTQALGISYVLAQGGISVPAESFTYTPVDNIFTHYPADEIQTMDLGRLGEETKRFKELYQEATGSSLLLLNESFSTTSFEEGYYIACDVIRALLHKGIRTVYNTHMHKLAEEAEDFARKEGTVDKAVSLVAKPRVQKDPLR